MAASAVGLAWLWVHSSLGEVLGLPWFIGSGGRHPAGAALATISGGLAIFHSMCKVKRIEGNVVFRGQQQLNDIVVGFKGNALPQPRVTT
jgi:hypothetical protein